MNRRTTIPTTEFVPPEGFIPAAPGGKAVPIPTHFTDDLHLPWPDSPETQAMIDSFFAATRDAAEGSSADGDDEPILRDPDQPSFPANPLPMAEHIVSDTSADGLVRYDDAGNPTYLHLMEQEDGTIIAVHADSDEPLLDAKGKPIVTDENGIPVPPPKRWYTPLLDKLGNRTDGDDAPVVVYTRDGIPIGDFDVVAPGAAPSNGRGRNGVRALMVASSFVLGTAMVAGLFGVVWGRSAVPAAGQISPEEASTYNLSSFPVDPASTFARHYVELCLTHPEASEGQQARLEMMKGMAVQQVGDGCGWSGGGAAENPVDVRFNGHVEEREEYSGGKVAYLGYFVSMSTGKFFNVTVPVWAGENEDGRDAYKIVGPLSMTAAPAQDGTPDLTTQYLMDGDLAGELNTLLTTFFKAWGASDRATISAMSSTDATGEVRKGLDRMVQDPKLDLVRVVPNDPPTSRNGNSVDWEYVDGSQVTALVNLTWTVRDEAGGRQQPAGYRVTLTYQAGKWLITALDPGVIAPGGGTESTSDGPEAVGGGFGSVEDLDDGSGN